VNLLLRFSRMIDLLNEKVGRTVYWLILLAVIIGAGNATIRYIFSTSSNAWLEIQWYLFSCVFLLGAGYTHLRNEHIRIDVFSGRLSRRGQTWLDVLGTIFFLLPMAIGIMVLSWPMVMDSIGRMEMSTDAGGLIRWPIKLVIPVGFGLLALQGISELIKRVGFLMGLAPDPAEKSHGSHGAPPPAATPEAAP
jgi:TRAP-type mannitol/chloroaromatic compound transport system permease small subunit